VTQTIFVRSWNHTVEESRLRFPLTINDDGAVYSVTCTVSQGRDFRTRENHGNSAEINQGD
jgi:hypothetical protein